MNDSGIKENKSKRQKNRRNSSKVEQNWTLNPDNYPKESTVQLNGKKTEKSKKASKQSLIRQFKEAIGKIFKGLDIFNRGTITQTNINKWIPEEALYFLGDIFQRIRSQRLNLSN